MSTESDPCDSVETTLFYEGVFGKREYIVQVETEPWYGKAFKKSYKVLGHSMWDAQRILNFYFDNYEPDREKRRGRIQTFSVLKQLSGLPSPEDSW